MLFPFVWFMLAMYETKEKRRCGVARWAQLWALPGAPDDFLVAAQVTQLCLAAAQKVTQPIYSPVSCRMTIMGVYGPRRMALKRAILWCYTLETLKAGLTTWRPYVGLSQLIWRGAFQPAQSSTSGNVGSVEPYLTLWKSPTGTLTWAFQFPLALPTFPLHWWTNCLIFPIFIDMLLWNINN